MTRESAVKDVYKKMRDGLAGTTVTYYHNGPLCKSNWYAYTYKGGTYVYLCNMFYTYPTACRGPGTYTKEFGLIHEWSHALVIQMMLYTAKNSLQFLIHIHVLMLCRNFELIPIKIGFFYKFLKLFKNLAKNS